MKPQFHDAMDKKRYGNRVDPLAGTCTIMRPREARRGLFLNPGQGGTSTENFRERRKGRKKGTGIGNQRNEKKKGNRKGNRKGKGKIKENKRK